MALINKVQNIASVTYDGDPISSLPAETLLLLPPLIEKTVDEAQASIGDVLTYTVIITNPSQIAFTDLPFSDPIPAGTTYVANSFEVDGLPATPTIENDIITYTIASVAAEDDLTITFQVTVVGGDV